MNLCAKLREVLEGGPSTVHEAALLLKRPIREVQGGMWRLKSSGHVDSKTVVPNDAPMARRRIKLYELTPRGRRMRSREVAQ